MLAWGPIAEADLGALGGLARDCVRADGGLPTLTEESMLTELFLSGPAIGGRDETGDLVAVAALFRDPQGRQCATGLVHPSSRHLGYGEQLVEWCREQAPGVDLLVVAETMSLEAESLFARSGLRRTFAETVMRHKLKHIPKVPLPKGVETEPFTESTAPAFAQAFRESFGTSVRSRVHASDREWLEFVRGSSAFRPDLSRVALADGEPVGLVILDGAWIDQVGVIPSWRGRGLGAHLVVRSLTALKHAEVPAVWLCVNVDNPSRFLYERLGFRAQGTRARYENR